MLRIGRLAVVLSVFSAVASAQEDPLAWFPLQVGSRWVYEHESKSGDRNRPEVDRWTTEERITGRVTIPEGLVVLREVKQLPNASDQTTTVRAIAPMASCAMFSNQAITAAFWSRVTASLT